MAGPPYAVAPNFRKLETMSFQFFFKSARCIIRLFFHTTWLRALDVLLVPIKSCNVFPIDVVHEGVYVDSLNRSAENARSGAKVVIAVVGPGCTAILRGALPTGMVAVTFWLPRSTTDITLEPSFVM